MLIHKIISFCGRSPGRAAYAHLGKILAPQVFQVTRNSCADAALRPSMEWYDLHTLKERVFWSEFGQKRRKAKRLQSVEELVRGASTIIQIIAIHYAAKHIRDAVSIASTCGVFKRVTGIRWNN